MKSLNTALSFNWDKGNVGKNKKHAVTEEEAEEPFFDERKKTFPDRLLFRGEERFRIIGKTKTGRLLFVVFTIRKGTVRIISARDANRKTEAPLYEKNAEVAKI